MAIERDAGLPAQLQSLDARQKQAINDLLSNDEASTDDELAEHLISSLDLTREQADLVVGYRDQALSDMSFELFPGHHPF